jgi:hypothetical protein
MQRAHWQITFFLALFAAIVSVPGAAQAETFRCRLLDVAVYPERIHCQCTTTTPDGTSNIRYFAVSTKDAKTADRLLTVCLTVLVSGRRFIADYTKGDVSGGGPGGFNCAANDCRKLKIFGME